MNYDVNKLEAIFSAALEVDSPQERERYLEQACGPDVVLRRKVESLLEASMVSETFLPERSAQRSIADAEMLGAVIGHYKLIKQIGEGGFGAIYLAEQLEPLRRQVALKIIKAGMDTHQVTARFEAEHQTLALMDHPNIVKVFEAGATEQGRPFFVMELVQGLPITKFCEEHRLPVAERLKLFIIVCQAVQHAHQNGVIHRDIKPSNVLVALDIPVARGTREGGASAPGNADRCEGGLRPGTQSRDPNPQCTPRREGLSYSPKIIDFGVAKAMSHRLTDRTLFTHPMQMIGTPSYMSPEQANTDAQDVDTRTDVYSLGTLLYELLTGTIPFPEGRFKEVGYSEMQRIITEEEPIRPSIAITRDRESARKLAHQCQSEPASVSKMLRGDLDWIVLKAIEKDRTLRYATTLELAGDLQRYLDHEPVSASAPTTIYKIRKFAIRNRSAVLVILTVLLALILGTIMSTW